MKKLFCYNGSGKSQETCLVDLFVATFEERFPALRATENLQGDAVFF